MLNSYGIMLYYYITQPAFLKQLFANLRCIKKNLLLILNKKERSEQHG